MRPDNQRTLCKGLPVNLETGRDCLTQFIASTSRVKKQQGTVSIWRAQSTMQSLVGSPNGNYLAVKVPRYLPFIQDGWTQIRCLRDDYCLPTQPRIIKTRPRSSSDEDAVIGTSVQGINQRFAGQACYCT